MTSPSKLNARLVPIAAFLLLFVAVVALNVFAAFVPLRLDVTEEGLYTLSQGTKEILQATEDPVTLKLYYSQNLPDMPVSFTTYSTKVVDLLREYEATAPAGKIRLEIHDPAPDTEDEEWATRYGLSPARLPNGANLYFGLVALSAEREAVVPFFDPRRERFLEYDISEAIARVDQEARPKLGLISSLPVMGFGGGGMMMGAQGGGQPAWTVMQALGKSFEITELYPDQLSEIPENVNVVMVVHPKRLPDLAVYALDQFVLRGGKLVVLVDPESAVDQSGGGRMGAPTNSDLPRLFKAWGVTYDSLKVVGDLGQSTRVNTQQGVADYPLYLSVTPQHMNSDSVISSQLEELLLPAVGRFELAEDSKLKIVPLVSSSADSGMVDFTTARMMEAVTVARLVEVDNTEKTLAALLTGRFPSAFPDGAPPVPPEDPRQPNAVRPTAPTRPHVSEAQAESSVVLIGDVDFMHDHFAVQHVNFFGNVVAQPKNDNLNLVLNATEALAGSQALIHIRSRGQFSRPFTRVAELQVQAAAQYREEEQRLSDKLDEVKRQLNALERARPQGGEAMLSDEQLDALQQYRLEEQRTRAALREVRKVLRQDIESLGNTLLAINLLVMPLLVAVVGFVVIYRRTRRSGGTR